MVVYLQMIEGEDGKRQFAALYETYRGLMFYTANSILHNSQDAEDAVHQAFISLAENFSKIKTIECPQTRAFVVIIVERKAIDLLRKRNRQAEVGMNEAIHGIDIPMPGDNGLADAMASLPAHAREILLLRYYNGYTTTEIADFFGVSYAAMKKQLTRAKTALKKRMEEGDMSHAE